MKLFIDTNIFIAAAVEEPGRGDLAVDFLNKDYEFCTTLLNLMEFRTVLAKKKQLKQEHVQKLLAEITESVEVYAPELSEIVDAYDLQEETLLYPMDCLVLATARSEDGELVTFDTELLENGAKSPDEFV